MLEHTFESNHVSFNRYLCHPKLSPNQWTKTKCDQIMLPKLFFNQHLICQTLCCCWCTDLSPGANILPAPSCISMFCIITLASMWRANMHCRRSAYVCPMCLFIAARPTSAHTDTIYSISEFLFFFLGLPCRRTPKNRFCVCRCRSVNIYAMNYLKASGPPAVVKIIIISAMNDEM